MWNNQLNFSIVKDFFFFLKGPSNTKVDMQNLIFVSDAITEIHLWTLSPLFCFQITLTEKNPYNPFLKKRLKYVSFLHPQRDEWNLSVCGGFSSTFFFPLGVYLIA